MSLVVFGSTGYIGRAVVKELALRGHDVTAFTREKSGISGEDSSKDVESSFGDFSNVKVVTGDVMDEASIAEALGKVGKVDGAVCCLASRSGGRQDSFDIDYQATINCHKAVKGAGGKHFSLLSAICVQKPLLAFQEAKLKAEAYIKENSGDMAYSLVQPTAFFKSLLGQVKGVKGGSPYVMFGDGSIACKPISEDDLAAFIGDCFWDPAKQNATLPIGGPGKALTFKEQGTLLHEVIGKEPNLISVPTALFDVINGFLDFLAGIFPQQLSDVAEYGKIGKYYATECMLVLDKETGEYREDLTPSYGRTSLKDFLTEAMQEGSTLMEAQKLGEQGLGSRLGVKVEE
jgi:divinyl chlorophyllide a 8-vinyl-reductase